MTDNTSNINSYLCFKLGNEFFAADVRSTLKILQLSEITKVPHAPTNMKGVINHHGNVLPVVDLNQTLELPISEVGSNTCIIIMSVGGEKETISIGAIVDEVLSVEEIADDSIKDPPTMGGNHKLDYIKGVFENNDLFVMVLDIDKIFENTSLQNN